MPTGKCELSLKDLPCPFISILIMFDAVLAKLGVPRPEKQKEKKTKINICNTVIINNIYSANERVS